MTVEMLEKNAQMNVYTRVEYIPCTNKTCGRHFAGFGHVLVFMR